ncbi:hypothetical protein FQA39_LY10597 [Lamprigera yunnana]|nr:hypothetical protein FQA39_LY10597 [Lamprigera yunnana]
MRAILDFDPKASAGFEFQKPNALPLSYILKYSPGRCRKPTNLDIRMRLLQHASKTSLEKRNNKCTPIPSVDESEVVSESESSNDSWTPKGNSFKLKKASNKKNKINGIVKTGSKKLEQPQGLQLESVSAETVNVTSAPHSVIDNVDVENIHNRCTIRANLMIEDQEYYDNKIHFDFTSNSENAFDKWSTNKNSISEDQY